MLTTVILAATLQTVACTAPSFVMPPVMGHRGSGKSNGENPFAENTLPSFENAYKEGAEYVELDVQLSKDGQVVVMHDFSTEKTTNLPGCVADYTYAQLTTADATLGSAATAKVGVPLLSEVLALAKEKSGFVNIEIKVNDEATACPKTDVAALVTATVAEVKAAKATDRVIFSSFSFGAAKEAKKQLPATPSGLLSAEGGDVLLKQAADAKAAGLDTINPMYAVLIADDQLMPKLRGTGLKVYPWTVNDRADMDVLLTQGADALITDDVPTALAAREALFASLDSTYRESSCPRPSANEDDSGCTAAGPGAFAALLLPLGVLAFRRARRR
jgi:glycerophosphoryl diester phosphodiesterase